MTVASLAMITHSTRETRPMPVINPAAGTASSYIPYAASWDNSRNGVPGSSNRRMRSRGRSLPRSRCFLRARSPPPSAIPATRSRNSSHSASIRSAFCRNSSPRGFIMFSMTLILCPFRQDEAEIGIYLFTANTSTISRIGLCTQERPGATLSIKLGICAPGWRISGYSCAKCPSCNFLCPKSI